MLKLGLVGSSKITDRAVFIPVSMIPDMEVTGISTRNKDKITHKDNVIYYDDYRTMISGNDIDAVYLPLPNALHKQFITDALDAGKHVLVEKPFCLKRNDTNEIIRISKENNLIVHEALMTQHHEWAEKISDIIRSEQYGRLTKVISYFYSTIEENATNYRFNKDMGGGCFYDFSPYWIHFLQKTVGLNPMEISVTPTINGKYNIDAETDVYLKYPGCEVEFHASFNKPFKASHHLTFEDGTLEIKNFLRPMLGFHKFYFDIIKNDTLSERIEFPKQNYYHNQLVIFKQLCMGEITVAHLHDELSERIGFMENLYEYVY